ncbi:hypothetical protein [Flavobacterium oreochromis]|nr:hypothetical protein [Flavobacterium oreochromis]
MDVDFYKLRDILLSHFIEEFYFVNKKELNEVVMKYWTFPNNYSIVAVY